VENTSNTKAIAVWNNTGAPVSLANYQLQEYANATATPNGTLALTGTSLAQGSVWVVCYSSTPFPAGSCDQVSTGNALSFNGNDTVVLSHTSGGAVADSIGKIADNPTSQWGTSTLGTLNQALRHKCPVVADTNPNDAFDPTVNWVSASTSYSDLHTYSCP
jgi:predicted extracellular nuclease